MDKLAAALISAPVGAVFGFLGAVLMELLKRRLSHLDKLIEATDEISGELTDVGRALGRGQRPTEAEIRALLKLRRQFGINLQRLFAKKASWKKVRDALAGLDHCIEVLDEAALGDGELLATDPGAEDVGRRLDAAVRGAAGEDRLWKWLRAR